MQIFYIFLAESFVSSEKLHTFAAQKGFVPCLLGYGVMVTLQILVLPFLVRVRVAQQRYTTNKNIFITTMDDYHADNYDS